MTDTNFNSWLTLNESTKISDYLKTLEKAQVQAYKNFIRSHLSANIRNNQQLEAVVNYFTYLYIAEQLPLAQVATQIERDWGQFRAYITSALGSSQRGNLALVSFDRENLETANAKYHRDLAAKRGKRKGPEGHAVISISDALQDFKNNHPDINAGKSFLPDIWEGWSWVSLGCGSSSEEAAAGGHCGNSGATRGDNIFSLRDPLNRVHLTFVININSGTLGEAKAVDNNKPADSYHAPIVALLLSNYVKKIDQSDTYMPENDFKVEDLKNARVKKVVEDHLAGVEEHKRPENYLPWSWIDQWNQEHVDSLLPGERVRFLKEVLKVVDNHEPFTAYDYDYDVENKDDRYKLRPEFQKPQPLKFDLNKLALDCLGDIDNLKAVIAMLKDLNSIRNNVRGASTQDWTIWFPEDEGKDKEDIDYSYDRPKSATFDIDQATINYYANKAIDLAGQGSTRDKADLIEELESIGYRDTGPPNHKELSNRFQAEMDQLESEIIDEVIKNGRARPVETSTVTGYVQDSLYPYRLPDEPIPEEEDTHHGYIRGEKKLENHIQTEISKDGRKVIGYFTYSEVEFSKIRPTKAYRPKGTPEKILPMTEREKKFVQHVKELYEKHLDLLKRHGYSPYLEKRNKNHNQINRYVEKMMRQLKKMIVADVSKRIKQELKGIATTVSKGYYNQGPEVKVFVPVVEALKAARANKAPAPYKKVDDLLKEYEGLYFDRNLPKLEGWLVKNAHNLATYVNGPAEKYVKGKGMVPVDRDVDRRHHQRTRPRFAEWAEQRDMED